MDDATLTQPAPTTPPVSQTELTPPLPTVEYGAGDIKPDEEQPTQLPREARGRRWAVWQLAVVAVVVGVVAGAAVAFAVTRNSRTEHTTPPSVASAQSDASPPTAAAPTPEAEPAPSGAGCGVDLAAPRVVAAVQQLPPYPDTGWTWNADPATFQGNYNPCATLSTVLATVEMATGSSPVTALMFHDGDYLGTATLKAYDFTSLNTAQTTDDTVVLDYKLPGACTACPPAGVATVRYQWQNDHVEMLDSPPDPGAPAPNPAPIPNVDNTNQTEAETKFLSELTKGSPSHHADPLLPTSGNAEQFLQIGHRIADDVQHGVAPNDEQVNAERSFPPGTLTREQWTFLTVKAVWAFAPDFARFYWTCTDGPMCNAIWPPDAVTTPWNTPGIPPFADRWHGSWPKTR